MCVHKKILMLLAVLLFSAAAMYHKSSDVPLIPRKVLFGSPEKSNPKISPDGKKLAYIAPIKGVRNIWVKTIGKNDDVAITTQLDRDIGSCYWSFDNEHLFYAQDKDGDENWHLYMIDLQTKKIKDLTPFEGARIGSILSFKKEFPDEMLLTINKRDPKLFDVYKLNLKTYDLEMVAENPGNVTGWVPDENNKVRAAQAARKDGGYDWLVKDDEKSEWRKIAHWTVEDNGNFFCFSKDGKSLYAVDSRDANTGRLIKIDTKTGQYDVIFEDPQYDFGGIIRNKHTKKLEAGTVSRAKKEWIFFDDEVKKDFNELKKISSGEISLVDSDNSYRKWVVTFTKDDGPRSYWIFDRDTKKGTFLFYTMPALKKYELAKMEPISFASRDGLTIHGYLTCPVGKKRENLPLVLFVHGGPWARDSWGCNTRSQWLANRGYAVLQVNYRGSTGYGKQFLNAANKQWSLKMHDDLVDAVQWIVDCGIADPKKVAIFGGSYGGYAALAGATFTPDLFCCAIDVCGPSNLITLIKSFPAYWETMKYKLYKRVGNPDTEKEFLESCSPLFKADKIKIPMMIVQGANDPRVTQIESDQIVDAMKKNGVTYEYLLFDDEGHGLVKEVNRLKFYAAAEKFLANSLGGRCEA